MVEFLTAAAILLMAIVAAGLVRLLLGPGIADRLMAVQLLGTGSAGMLLLSASAVPMAGAVDVAWFWACSRPSSRLPLSRAPIRRWRAKSDEHGA